MAATDSDIRFEQPRSTFGTWIGVVLLFGLFALIAWALLGVMPRGDDYEEKRGIARVEKLKAYHEEMSKQVGGYAWVDKAKGTVRMPIDRAMELSVAELAQRKPAIAGPLPPEGDKAGLQVTAPVGPTPAPVASPGGAPRPTPAIAIEGKDSETEGQAAAAVNPPNAAPGTQPGPSATPAAAPPSGANQANPGGKPQATPVQSPPGTPIPVPGVTPR
ncbi:MAG TPA: hypothetical protein VF683_07665 [Chthoniobacterales bacterium]